MILFTSVADAGFDRQFKDRILAVYSLFEELQGRPVKCGYIRRGSALLGTARSWADPQRIALQPGVGNTTIAHELVHLLQGAGVPHGETSCVMLPATLAWNKPINFEEQVRTAEAFGRPGDEAADCVRDLVASLGLPTRLRDVGVKYEDFDLIAEKSMHDHAVKTNPRPITEPAQVREILELAW